MTEEQILDVLLALSIEKLLIEFDDDSNFIGEDDSH